jgi:hypothetical protein
MLVKSIRESKNVDAAKKILDDINLFELELMWDSRISSSIKWYDKNFATKEWTDNKLARAAVDKALNLLGTSYTKQDLVRAYDNILDLLKYRYEIKEAKGLLG